jgi:hypothetical protein
MNERLPALSLREPWLWAILFAGKNVENRSWSTRYRGRIRLHAAQTWDPEGERWLRACGFAAPTESALRRAGRLGAYVGEVTVVDCLPYDDGTDPEEEPNLWACGPWIWCLKDPLAYPEPIPGRGYPGLYWPERLAGRGR